MADWLLQPWPWYIAGPLIGLTVPFLLLIGNKNFGLSSSFRHLCAAVLPTRLPYFRYNWKMESWNLIFIAGVMGGAAVASTLLANPDPVLITQELADELTAFGLVAGQGLSPELIFSFEGLLSVRGAVLMVAGGFLVGFGTRYAGGCTSGHSISGLSTLQLSSLKASLAFFAGGLAAANFLVPFILSL